MDQIWPMGHSLLTPSLDHVTICTMESISNNIYAILSTWLNSENEGYNLYLLFLLFKLLTSIKKKKTKNMYSNSSSIIFQRAGIMLTWQHGSYTIDFSQGAQPCSHCLKVRLRATIFKEDCLKNRQFICSPDNM